MQGRKIKGLVTDSKTQVYTSYVLDLRNLSHGIYMYKMQTPNYSAVKRLIVE